MKQARWGMRLLILGMCLILSAIAKAQTKPQGSIKVRTEVHSDKVLLRWITSDAKTWESLNKHGVRLERLTIARNGQALPKPEVQILGAELKPRETDELKAIATQYPMGLVMAQAVFGEDFEVGLGDNPMTKAIALDEQREQRYLFSAYAADLCYPVAKVMGWGWEDTSVKQGERYLYKVVSLSTDKKLPIKEGLSFVIMGQNTQLVKPQALSARFGDASAQLSWDYNGLVHLYNSYIVERSEDGSNFSPITPEPITRLSDGEKSPHAPITYADSIANLKTYYYRVTGITPFGTKSAYSLVVSGMGYPSLKAIPMISSASFNEKGGIQMSWTFSREEEELLESFSILHSTNDKKYVPFKQGIAPSARSYTIDSPKAKYVYYKIEAKPKRGASTESLPILLQPIDSIPPSKPRGLKAQVDSLGKVQLSWTANKEADILGYRLYRGESKGEELIPITDIAIQDTLYQDSVHLHSLNSKVYYALTALDHRYNQSEQSETVEALKPNVLAPVAPSITGIERDKEHTILHWEASEDPYLAGFIIFRKEHGSNTLRQVDKIEDKTQRTYRIKDEPGKSYIYQMQAYSTKGLLSAMSEGRTRTAHISEKPLVDSHLSLSVLPEGAIAIRWTTQATALISLALYKTDEQGRLYLYRDSLPAEGEVVDSQTLQGKSNTYALVVKHKGSKPQMIKRSISL